MKIEREKRKANIQAIHANTLTSDWFSIWFDPELWRKQPDNLSICENNWELLPVSSWFVS